MLWQDKRNNLMVGLTTPLISFKSMINSTCSNHTIRSGKIGKKWKCKSCCENSIEVDCCTTNQNRCIYSIFVCWRSLAIYLHPSWWLLSFLLDILLLKAELLHDFFIHRPSQGRHQGPPQHPGGKSDQKAPWPRPDFLNKWLIYNSIQWKGPKLRMAVCG